MLFLICGNNINLDLIAHGEAVIRQFDEDAGVGILHGEAAGRNVVHGHHAALYIIVVADRHRFGALHGADGRNIGLHGIVGARTLRLALDFEHDVVEEEAHVLEAMSADVMVISVSGFALRT